MMHVRTLAMVMLAALMIGIESAPAAVNLQPRFEAGQWSRFEVWVLREQTGVTRAQGQVHNASSTIEIQGHVLWEVRRVAGDGSATCAMTLEWMTADVTLPTGDRQHNDSRRARGDTEPTHGMLRAMAGVPLEVEVGADGSIRAVRGVEAMQRRAPEGVTVPDERDFIETCTDLAILAAAPAQAEAGANWSARFAWNHPLGTMRHDMRYRLVGVEDVEGVPIATVTGDARLALEVDRSQLPADGPRMDVRLTRGSFTTQILFDLNRHEAVGRNSVQETQIRVNISLEGQNITTTMDEVVQSQVMRVAESQP